MPEVTRCGECGGTLVDHCCRDCGTRHDPGQRAGDAMTEQGMNLTQEEAVALAKRMIADHLRHTDWLMWEDVPNLGEHAYERLLDTVVAETKRLGELSDYHDRGTGIDSRYLKERAQ